MERNHIGDVEKRLEGGVTRVRDRLEAFGTGFGPGERGGGGREDVDWAGKGVLRTRINEISDEGRGRGGRGERKK